MQIQANEEKSCPICMDYSKEQAIAHIPTDMANSAKGKAYITAVVYRKK